MYSEYSIILIDALVGVSEYMSGEKIVDLQAD